MRAPLVKKTFVRSVVFSLICIMPSLQAQPKIKNLILIIGDGMGPQQVGLLETYAQRAPNSIYKGKPTAFTQMAQQGYVGLSTHWPMDASVVDSACSATQLALGLPAPSESIGVNANGDAALSILERAKKMGKSTGLVSDTRLTHATPASFAAHQPHRSLENEIAVDMLNAAPDVMLSGGMRHWIPKSANSDDKVKQQLQALTAEPSLKIKSKRGDDRNLLLEAKSKGYQLAFNRNQLDSAKGKILGLFAYSGMQDGTDYVHKVKTAQPSLEQMSMKAIDELSKNNKGFFLMIEGGQIDWAAHYNDAGGMLHEMIKFDHMLEAVLNWAKLRDDTLVVVTADHETGGFGLSYSRHQVPKHENLPGDRYEKAGYQYSPNFNFGPLASLDKLFNQKKSFSELYWNLEMDESEHPTPDALMKAVNDNLDFKITLEQAKRILMHEKNKDYIEGHKSLGTKELPKFDDFEAFYVYGEEDHIPLIGREVARQQNVVWGTGTHTHTPVPVIAFGPESVARQYSRLLHHVDLGKLMQTQLLGLPNQ